MNKRKILSYILIPIISVYLLVCNLSIVSFADVPSTQKVVSHTGSWSYTSYPSLGGTGKYYTIEDATGITPSTYSSANFFYTKDGITFDYLKGINLITNQLNKIVGVVLSPEIINSFWNKVFDIYDLLDDNNHAQNGLYDSNNQFLGYCLNDIGGCYYAHNANDTNIPIPSYFPNNIKQIVDTEFIDDIPPYIVYSPIPNANVINNYNGNLTATVVQNYNSLLSNHKYIFRVAWRTDINKFQFSSSSYGTPQNNHYLYYNDDVTYFCANNATGFTEFCTYNGLDVLNYELSFGELYNHYNMWVHCYDSNFERVRNFNKINLDNNNIESYTIPSSNQNGDNYPFYLGNWNNGNYGDAISTPINAQYVIYKDINTLLSFNNNSYYPTSYVTNNYRNYDITSDNSNNVSTQNVDNSVTYNSDIFNSSSDSYYTYYDNGVIDNSSVTNNVTNITNNYYGTSNGGNNGGGGSSDNDGVLDTLLEGLLAFFNAIGRVLATVITGILDMFTTVLEAIASITTDLTGVTDFFGSLFGWLPDPIPQVLGVGISVCILCAVIRFIRG